MTQIELTPVTGSSLILADGWSQDKTTLVVKFHNGLVYQFANLSPAIHTAYEGAESKGKFLKRTIEPMIKGVPV